MKFREWLEMQGKNDRVTIIIAKAVKDEHTPFYHNEYSTTPIWSVWEWLRGTSADKYFVTNANHPPIDVTGNWQNEYKSGFLKCCIVTTEADHKALYRSEEQEQRMIEWYDKKAREAMSNK